MAQVSSVTASDHYKGPSDQVRSFSARFLRQESRQILLQSTPLRDHDSQYL